MDILQHIWEKLCEYIDFGYMFAFMFLALTLKLSGVFAAVGRKLFYKWTDPNKYLVFIIAILLAIPFRLIYDTDIAKLIVSFGVGTSLYDLALEDFIKWVRLYIKKRVNEQEVTQ